MLNNLFDQLAHVTSQEHVDSILATDSMRIERIVSSGQSSVADYWYDQSEHEWVMVLQGSAVIRFDPQGTIWPLLPGDFLNIPAGQKHQVQETSPDEQTIWLAVFYN